MLEYQYPHQSSHCCRRMFPTVKVTAEGLEPSQHYFVLMDIVLAEEFRYKYSGKEWVLAGKAEPQLPARSVLIIN